MEIIKVGLDFGTHQTKVCLQFTPDEGHGEPRYEFFKFKDLKGRYHYTLPSIVQINEDDTLSYGFVDFSREKNKTEKPELKKVEYMDDEFDIEDVADYLYAKYKTAKDTIGDKDIIRSLLSAKKDFAINHNKQEEATSKRVFNEEMNEYYKKCSIFRYFKQATFSDRPWHADIPSEYLSIWFLSYVIFLLEERFGADFSINMGIPADENTYKEKRKFAVSILASAYNLVENVYANDFSAFKAERIDTLFANTEIIDYSNDLKEEYYINVFPEAYASLISLTSKGKISTGLALNADIGGGTTDITFFAIEGKSRVPYIYRYWSLPYGLNYIAEQSGYDYSEIEKAFASKASKSIIEEYKEKNKEVVRQLYKDLIKQLRKETNISQTPLFNALRDKVVVFSGGGSVYPSIIGPIETFTNDQIIDSKIWKEENVNDMDKVNKICNVLSTSFGLSIDDDDSHVQLRPFTNLFKGIGSKEKTEHQMVDKDCC